MVKKTARVAQAMRQSKKNKKQKNMFVICQGRFRMGESTDKNICLQRQRFCDGRADTDPGLLFSSVTSVLKAETGANLGRSKPRQRARLGKDSARILPYQGHVPEHSSAHPDILPEAKMEKSRPTTNCLHKIY